MWEDGEVTLWLWSWGAFCSPQVHGLSCMPISTIRPPPSPAQPQSKPWGKGTLGKVKAAEGRRMYPGSAVFVSRGQRLWGSHRSLAVKDKDFRVWKASPRVGC